MRNRILASVMVLAPALGALGDRRYATDSNDAIVWTLDETSSPWANSGVEGTLNLNAGGADVVAGVPGLVAGNGLFVKYAYGQDAYTSATSVGEASDVTWSAWLTMTALPTSQSYYRTIFAKDYSGGSASSVIMVADYGGAITVTVKTTSSPGSCTCGGAFIRPGVTSFLGFVYSSVGSLSLYQDGRLVGSTSCSGYIDWGSHGAYHVGGYSPNGGSYEFWGSIDDVRVATVARPTSWWHDVFAQGTQVVQEPWNVVGATGQPAFQSSWTNFGGAWSTAGFFKDANGIVHLRGEVKGGTPPSYVFTLPAGYRPSTDIAFPQVDGVNALAVIIVFPTGGVWVQQGNNGQIGFDGITFDTR